MQNSFISELIQTSKNLNQLLKDVESQYSSDANFIIKSTVNYQGAFDYQNEKPTFIFRTDCLNESNIAHELIHALQYKNGFPIIIKNLTNDKRFEIIKELNSNLLHISLVKEMINRGISPKDYIKEVVEKVKKFIKDDIQVQQMYHGKKERRHYDALMLLRIEYEAIYMKKIEKEKIYRMYKRKMPEVYNLFVKIKTIISANDPSTPSGVLACLKIILTLFNKDINYTDYLKLLDSSDV